MTLAVLLGVSGHCESQTIPVPQALDASTQNSSVDSTLSDKQLSDKASEEFKQGDDEAALRSVNLLLARYPVLGNPKLLQTLPPETVSLIQDAAITKSMIETRQKYFADTGKRVENIGGAVSSLRVTHSADPSFSKEAKAKLGSAKVLLNLIVDEQGLPRYVHVVRFVGMGLDEEAVKAVSKYRFKPAMENGKPVAVMMDVEINFQVVN
jgi:TonB family protein